MIDTVLETPHVIVGAAIATKISNPYLALPLSLASHFVLDLVPHWNPHLNTEKKKYGKITNSSTAIVTADALMSLGSGVYLASRTLPNTNHFWVIIGSCFLAVLPDLIEAPYFFINIKSEFIDKWVIFQKSIQANAAPLFGLFTQILTIIAALMWIGS